MHCQVYTKNTNQFMKVIRTVESGGPAEDHSRYISNRGSCFGNSFQLRHVQDIKVFKTCMILERLQVRKEGFGDYQQW